MNAKVVYGLLVFLLILVIFVIFRVAKENNLKNNQINSGITTEDETAIQNQDNNGGFLNTIKELFLPEVTTTTLFTTITGTTLPGQTTTTLPEGGSTTTIAGGTTTTLPGGSTTTLPIGGTTTTTTSFGGTTSTTLTGGSTTSTTQPGSSTTTTTLGTGATTTSTTLTGGTTTTTQQACASNINVDYAVDCRGTAGVFTDDLVYLSITNNENQQHIFDVYVDNTYEDNLPVGPVSTGYVFSNVITNWWVVQSGNIQRTFNVRLEEGSCTLFRSVTVNYPPLESECLD